jgi:3-oxoacyl-[acyl-carrier protein] reductase
MQCVVITGGMGDLGQAIAAEFSDDTWQVAAPGRSELDVTDLDQLTAYFRSHPADLLICAAGAVADGPLAKLDSGAWDESIAINYHGAARSAAAVLPGMIGRGRGHIVFLSSYSAVHPPAGQTAYATGKAALLGLARELALRHGPANIRVNSILPGFLETRMTAAVSQGRRAAVLTNHALGRFNTVDAVARFIRRLHDELPHTSGQVFQLDSRPC